jgi:hypothetical protein
MTCEISQCAVTLRCERRVQELERIHMLGRGASHRKSAVADLRESLNPISG